MKVRVYFKTVAVVAVLFFGLAGSICAQADQGRIAGTVTDPNGAIVPGAKVTVTDQATGLARTTVANDDGAFQVANLKPGKYTVDVTAGNFAPVKKTDVDVLVGQQVNIDIKLPAQGVAIQI